MKFIGPNEGKTELEQIIAVARALTAFKPYYFDTSKVMVEKTHNYEVENKKSLRGKWIKQISPMGTWFIIQDSEFSGRSGKELPQGETCEITFYCSEKEANRTAEMFTAVVNQVEKKFSVADFIKKFPTDVYNYPAEKAAENFRKLIENLKGTVSAINPDFNKERIIEFRNWLEKLTQTQEVIRGKLSKYPSNVNHFLAVKPKHLIAFSKHLAIKRKNHCVDALLFGSIATTVDVCRFIAEKDTETKQGNDAFKEMFFLTTFNSMAIYLTSSELVDPVKILAATVSRAVNSGYGKALLEIVDKYHNIVNQKIIDAVNAENTDIMLDILYQAIPYAFGAMAICANLRTCPIQKIDIKTKKIANGKFCVLDENIVRFVHSFSHQIYDFNGQNWNYKKKIISENRKNGNNELVEKYIQYWIDQSLFYPRSVINQLLN